MLSEQQVTLETEDGGKYSAILFGGRLGIWIVQSHLAKHGLVLEQLFGRPVDVDGNGLSCAVF